MPLLQSAGYQSASCNIGQHSGQSASLCLAQQYAATWSALNSNRPRAAAAHLLHGLGKHSGQHLGVSCQHVPAGQVSPPQPKACPLIGSWTVRLCTAIQCNRASLLIPGDVQGPVLGMHFTQLLNAITSTCLKRQDYSTKPDLGSSPAQKLLYYFAYRQVFGMFLHRVAAPQLCPGRLALEPQCCKWVSHVSRPQHSVGPAEIALPCHIESYSPLDGDVATLHHNAAVAEPFPGKAADRPQCCRTCPTCEPTSTTAWQLLSHVTQEVPAAHAKHTPHRWAGMWRPSTTNWQSLSSEVLNRRWMAVRVRAGPQGERGLAGCFHHKSSTAGQRVDS